MLLVRRLLQEKISEGGRPAARPASDRRRDELRLHHVISEKRLSSTVRPPELHLSLL